MDKFKELDKNLETLFQDTRKLEQIISTVGSILNLNLELPHSHIVQIKNRVDNLVVDVKKILDYGTETD